MCSMQPSDSDSLSKILCFCCHHCLTPPQRRLSRGIGNGKCDVCGSERVCALSLTATHSQTVRIVRLPLVPLSKAVNPFQKCIYASKPQHNASICTFAHSDEEQSFWNALRSVRGHIALLDEDSEDEVLRGIGHFRLLVSGRLVHLHDLKGFPLYAHNQAHACTGASARKNWHQTITHLQVAHRGRAARVNFQEFHCEQIDSDKSSEDDLSVAATVPSSLTSSPQSRGIVGTDADRRREGQETAHLSTNDLNYPTTIYANGPFGHDAKRDVRAAEVCVSVGTASQALSKACADLYNTGLPQVQSLAADIMHAVFREGLVDPSPASVHTVQCMLAEMACTASPALASMASYTSSVLCDLLSHCRHTAQQEAAMTWQPPAPQVSTSGSLFSRKLPSLQLPPSPAWTPFSSTAPVLTAPAQTERMSSSNANQSLFAWSESVASY